MKNIFYCISLAVNLFIIFLFGCSKPNSETSRGYWTVENSNFSINYTSRLDSLGYKVLTGSESLSSSNQPAINKIVIWFLSPLPTKSGSYEIVNVHDLNTSLSSTQIGISGILSKDYRNQCSGLPGFVATGIDDMTVWPWKAAAKAEVNITNGKFRIDIPMTTTVYHLTCGIDSPKLAGVFVEN